MYGTSDGFKGQPPLEERPLIGRVFATDATEAVSTLNAYRNGFGVTDPGDTVPNPYVEWAHDDIKSIKDSHVPIWDAREEA